MQTIIDYLEYWASVQADKCIYSFLNTDGTEKAGYTYREFCQHTRNLADYLSRTVGLEYGSRVLLVYPAGLDMIACFFACARIGVIPVPVPAPISVNLKSGIEKLLFVIADCQAEYALSTQDFYTTYSTLTANEKRTSATGSETGLPSLSWICTDHVQVHANSQFKNQVNPLLFLQYTSGSTSQPRGVMVSQQNVIHNALSTLNHVPICVTWLPQYHDMGLIGYYLFPVIAGGTTYGMSPLDFLKRPILWLQTITRVKATYASSPNFGFEYCLRDDKISVEQLPELDLSSLRTLMNASEPVKPETYMQFLEKFSACGLKPEAHVVAYGLAENTLAATHYGQQVITVNKRLLQQMTLLDECVYLQDHNQQRLVSCGKPIAGIILKIVDTQSRTALGEEQIGEIWLSGNSVCQGYWEQADLTQTVFRNSIANDPADKQLYLRTGDLGFLKDGELFVCGRIKDLIIIKGANYFPQDIEAIVEASSESIRSGGVAAFDGGTGDAAALIVVIEVRNAQNLPDPLAIIQAIRTQYFIAPHSLLFVPPKTIAKTSSGKLARNLTRQDFLNGRLNAIAIKIHVNQAQYAAELSNSRSRFRYLFEAFNLTGLEEYTFAELCMDSITMIQFLLDIQSLLKDKGVHNLLEKVDLQFIQGLRIIEFFKLLDELETAPQQALNVLSLRLMQAQQAYENLVLERMRADRLLPIYQPIQTDNVTPVTNVLLTGATGFLGPYLLRSLLLQTAHTFYVLIRAKDQKHGMLRIRQACERALIMTPMLAEQLEKRVQIICGDISQYNLGLSSNDWEFLSKRIQAICHNAALVNYILNYETLKPHNVDGTRELLRLAFAANLQQFHYISSTFIFGWTVKGILPECDNNEEMKGLDFGYSQSKWVAEQLVLAAEKQGLNVQIYRPSLISASTHGICDNADIAIRLLAFMINHQIAVDSHNQISFLPVDIVAHNIACIFNQQQTLGQTLHITADHYYNMPDVTRLITEHFGFTFSYYAIPDFITEMNRRCTVADTLYPLLDFFNQSFAKIAAMQLKRYNNDQYRSAREQSGNGKPDPSLEQTVHYLMQHLLKSGLIHRPTGMAAASAALS